MKVKKISMITMLVVVLALGLIGCTKQVEFVSLDKNELEVTHGETFVLNATVLPNDADDKSVVWNVDSAAVTATTNENTLQKEFLAANVGTAKVKVIASNGRQTVCDVTVTENEEDKAAREKEAEEKAKEEAKIAAEEKAKEKAKIAAEEKANEPVTPTTSTGNQTMSDDGVNFSELTLIPDKAITVKIDNTTRAAKRGVVYIACLDKDGLQLGSPNINFEINALTNDIIQTDRIPSGTVSVKFLSTTVIDK